MGVPTYDQFIEPILRLLAQNDEMEPARDIHEQVATKVGLSKEDKLETIPSGQLVYKNRCGWAHDRLKRAGLSSSPKHGYWQITEEGRRFIKEHSSPFSERLLKDLATGHLDVILSGEKEESEEAVDQAEVLLSPDERIQIALAELEASVAADLLERLGQVTPGYFETIVLDLLHKMGYGAKRGDLQQTRLGNDEGIDGVISLDALGLERVYVQAKRWKGSVGRPEIQAFYGALAGQKATKGVFLTTSHFTKGAKEFASTVERIILVDGERLTKLMVEHEVGISRRHLWIPSVDNDYFEE